MQLSQCFLYKSFLWGTLKKPDADLENVPKLFFWKIWTFTFKNRIRTEIQLLTINHVCEQGHAGAEVWDWRGRILQWISSNVRFGLIFKQDPISTGPDQALPTLAAFNHNQRAVCRVPGVGSLLLLPFLGQLECVLPNSLWHHTTAPMPTMTLYSPCADGNELINLIWIER